MKRIFSGWLYLVVCLVFLSLTGCLSFDKYNVSNYKKTLDHVKTHMFRWSPDIGGIYWVDNSNVLLDAYLENESGSLDRGLYQVNVTDERAEKIVDIPEEGETFFHYCFDGGVLHVMVEKGEFAQVTQPEDYTVAIRVKGKKKRTNRYSKLRCRFVDLPQIERTAYLPLKEEDGLIKNDGTIEDGIVRVFLVNDEGENIKQISDKRLDSRGVIGVRSYSPYLDAYFGTTAFKNDCTFITHVYRDNWKLEQEELCIEGWVSGSRLVSRLKGGYYVEHYNSQSGEPKHYVFAKDLRIPVGKTKVRGASVSPDGCIVAYGVGDGTFGKKVPKQELEIFNYCEFREKELKS